MTPAEIRFALFSSSSHTSEDEEWRKMERSSSSPEIPTPALAAEIADYLEGSR